MHERHYARVTNQVWVWVYGYVIIDPMHTYTWMQKMLSGFEKKLSKYLIIKANIDKFEQNAMQNFLCQL